MPELIYKTVSKTSKVYIGIPWTDVSQFIDIEKTVIITDNNVKGIYGNKFPDCTVLVVKAGEASKNLSTVESLLKQLLRHGVDRSWFILGIGGGVVSDIAGFVASIYMRGIGFGFISTSLLSQVDASIGGKNGVNLDNTKNVVGCFEQPDFVICDPEMLKTLPDDEYFSGLGELVKHAIIRDSDLFKLIELNTEGILNRNPELMANLVMRSVSIKKQIVETDERETGIRRLLNFGHTLGHAAESLWNMKHGYAVTYGMLMAAHLSVAEGFLDEKSLERIENLFSVLNLTVEAKNIDKKFINIMKKDKKREGDLIHFVYLKGIGEGIIKPTQVGMMVRKIKGNSL